MNERVRHCERPRGSFTAGSRVFARGAAAVLLLPLLSACGAEDPVLQVANSQFYADQVEALSCEQLHQLADLSALGTVVVRREVERVAEPLAERAIARERLRQLPVFLGAREMGIGEATLREAYAQDPAWELRVRHLVRMAPRWASPDERRAARAAAEQALQRVRGGEPFETVAADVSEEPGAARRGGLLQPGREGSWVAPFWRAAVALEPGEVSEVVETEYGYHVLKLESREPLPFSEASPHRLLQRLVPPQRARAAMELWAATRPPIETNESTLAAALAQLEDGDGLDTLVLARGEAGEYTALDLAATWATLDPSQREERASAPLQELGPWVEDDAREHLWSMAAREVVPELPDEARENALREEMERIEGWARLAGFDQAQEPASIAARALAQTVSSRQDARILRASVAGFHPLLRRAYAPSGAAVSSGSGCDSSSEIRKSENTR